MSRRTSPVALAMAVLGMVVVTGGLARADLLLTASPSSGGDPLHVLFLPSDETAQALGLTMPQFFSAEGSATFDQGVVDTAVSQLSFNFKFFTSDPTGVNGAFISMDYDVPGGDLHDTVSPLSYSVHAAPPASQYAFESDWLTFDFSVGELYYFRQSFGISFFVGVFEADGSTAALEINNLGVFSSPEPSTLIAAGLGALGFIGYAWRRRKT